jgi:hypothetical protein
MTWWCSTVICAVVLVAGSARAQGKRPEVPLPTELLIGRHFFIDIGPPNDYYDLFLIRVADNGTSLERVTITPAGEPCSQPATVEFARASVAESIGTFLENKNVCAIPEKELRREQKRCRKCPRFTGADITVQARCGDQTRRIRVDILDRDMFDQNPQTPEHTSWTMNLLARFGSHLGDNLTRVIQRPILPVGENPSPPAALPKETALLADVREGKLDGFFGKVPDKLSAIYNEAEKPPPPPPIVELVSSAPFGPISFEAPAYPQLAKAARVEGEVAFVFDVNSDGGTTNLRFLKGAPLLRATAETSVAGWKFSKEAAGHEIQATLNFRTNCPARK